MTPQFEHHRRKMAHQAFEIASRPIVKRMCDIRLMFTSPWMKFSDGRCIESGEEWTDEGARNLYAALEETIRVLERMYLEPPP